MSSGKRRDAGGRARKRPGVEQQREVIMAAAVDLFAARGTRAVPVADICKAAGVSRDTYYRCFADKSALVDQLYQSAVNDHIESVLHAASLDYDNPAWLHEVFDNTIDAILERHQVARFLFIEAADPRSPASEVIDRTYDRVARRMQNWCKAHYGKRPQRELFKSLLVATQWLVHNAINAGLKKSDIATAKAAAETLYLGVFTAIGEVSTPLTRR